MSIFIKNPGDSWDCVDNVYNVILKKRKKTGTTFTHTLKHKHHSLAPPGLESPHSNNQLQQPRYRAEGAVTSGNSSLQCTGT